MNLGFLPELLCLIPLLLAIYLGWKERKSLHSVTPFIAAMALLIVARLCDVIIQFPTPLTSAHFDVSNHGLIQWLDIVSDFTDTVGVFLLVFGFVRTINFQLEKEKQIKDLESLLPVCAWCKNIRTADGAWISMERYMMEKGPRHLTHGICPTCRESFRAESTTQKIEV